MSSPFDPQSNSTRQSAPSAHSSSGYTYRINSPLLKRRRTVDNGEVSRGTHPKTWRPDDSLETSTRITLTLNIFVDLVPQGMLMLPACLVHTGWISALILTFGFAVLCTCTMYWIACTVELTGKHTWSDIWERVYGKHTWFPPLMILIVSFCGCVSILTLWGEMMPTLLPVGHSAGYVSARTAWLMLAFVLLAPLCRIRDLASLSFSSTLAIFAVIFAISVVTLRACDGSYAEGGVYDDGVRSPNLGDQPLRVNSNSLTLVNLLSVGFLCHYNGCKYYRELKNPTPENFLRAVSMSVGLSACTFFLVMTVGFLTFGSATHSDILSSYAPEDTQAKAARASMGLAILLGLPLMSSATREAFIDLLKLAAGEEARMFRLFCDTIHFQDAISIFLLLMLVIVAWHFTDADMVMGVVGSISGTLTIFVLPSFLYAEATRKILGTEGKLLKLGLVWFVFALGISLSLLGLREALWQ